MPYGKDVMKDYIYLKINFNKKEDSIQSAKNQLIIKKQEARLDSLDIVIAIKRKRNKDYKDSLYTKDKTLQYSLDSLYDLEKPLLQEVGVFIATDQKLKKAIEISELKKTTTTQQYDEIVATKRQIIGKYDEIVLVKNTIVSKSRDLVVVKLNIIRVLGKTLPDSLQKIKLNKEILFLKKEITKKLDETIYVMDKKGKKVDETISAMDKRMEKKKETISVINILTKQLLAIKTKPLTEQEKKIEMIQTIRSFKSKTNPYLNDALLEIESQLK